MMGSKFSSNVVLAKARAMFGKGLHDEQYAELLNCQTVSEVALYLKNKTDYKEVLSSLNEANVHRGYLESLLKRKFFNKIALLCRYESSIGKYFSSFVIFQFEVEQIMHSLMFLLSGVAGDYLYTMPLYFNKSTKIDLMSLSQMKNFDDFLEAIKKTKYFALLKPFKPEKLEDLDLTGLENVMYSELYTELFENIEKNIKGRARKELLDMLTSFIDTKNFVRIIRMKKYYHSSNEEIYKALLPCGSMSTRFTQSLVEANDVNDVFKIMRQTSAGKRICDVPYVYIDELTNKIKFQKSKKYMRFSVNASVILFAYMFLLDIEISNIINIIEGIRYNIPNSEIKKMLTF